MSKLSDLLTSETGLKDEIDSLNTLHRVATDWDDIKVHFDDLDGIDNLDDKAVSSSTVPLPECRAPPLTELFF